MQNNVDKKSIFSQYNSMSFGEKANMLMEYPHRNFEREKILRLLEGDKLDD